MYKILIPILVGVALVVSGTIVQGLMNERFGSNDDEQLTKFTERLKLVPTSFGDWTSVEAPIDATQLKKSNVRGYFTREFRNKRTGQTVNVFLVTGTAFHVTLHTPEWCYRASGFEQQGDIVQPKLKISDDQTAQFATARFNKKGTSDNLRIFWSFTPDGKWVGPTHPRGEFGTSKPLLKVYFITGVPGNDTHENNVSREFAKEFLPIVDKIMFGPEAPAQPASQPAETSS